MNKDNPPVLWTSEEAATTTGGVATLPFKATGISINSQMCRPGDIFVALKGRNSDGHDYVQSAIQSGAVAAIVSQRPKWVMDNVPLLQVDDTLAALSKLGHAARARSNARIIAITGSVGKTGTKFALGAALELIAPTYWSARSFNNHLGVPLSLARLPREAEFGVFEIGTNHPGEIGPLAAQIKPHVAVITTLEPVHIENFTSLEAIADEKCEVFKALAPGGCAILNRDSPLFDRMSETAMRNGAGRIISFGEHGKADCRLLGCSLAPDSSEITADIMGQILHYKISLPGKHWVLNSLAVMATASALDVDVPRAAEALAALTPVEGRGSRRHITIPGGTFTLIDESWNASPVAMKAALKVLAGMRLPNPEGRRIAVLGDMLELGQYAHDMHIGLEGPILEAGVDLVFTCGPRMSALFASLPENLRGGHATDSDHLTPIILSAVRPGDTILVKGSLGSRMSRVVEALTALHQPQVPESPKG
ncbi:MAG TPA: UDP-N-acetylmuramoylalanyl-D-glutamyl-2,6-diaminopimelate--D-alanyl-D-alanine ligase [Rhodospirillaceae bacterium]|nr:MAG: hypothetical protein A2018_07935 [Alphaproteobacteria bacterium GWF2_58_20]HAU29998.1 UDP-N-acetylmuramoylalanyl-D-glutamyl-2,6-diaminopimelate--D-alanyl-D-alanine ligase [Rhodospirillaceae bacterium]